MKTLIIVAVVIVILGALFGIPVYILCKTMDKIEYDDEPFLTEEDEEQVL